MKRTATRRWDLVGLGVGAAIGIADYALFLFFGAKMEVGGRDVATAIMVGFATSYALLGFAVGRLAMARARARADADTIQAQLEALGRAQRRVVEQEKLAAIGRLAAGVAHEVRNPLGVIRASASLVRDGFAADDDSYRACEFICEETDRLNGLITALLTFARPTDPNFKQVSVDDVLGHALRLADDELSRRRIFADRATHEPLPELCADPDLLSQAVLDLALNAAEALDRDGRILIRASADARSVRLDVCDDGPGVAGEVAGQIFEPFFTTKAGGTGLGLPMAARIVEAHGGLLELVADAGAGGNGTGACFRMTLPIDGPAEVVGGNNGDRSL